MPVDEAQHSKEPAAFGSRSPMLLSLRSSMGWTERTCRRLLTRTAKSTAKAAAWW